MKYSSNCYLGKSWKQKIVHIVCTQFKIIVGVTVSREAGVETSPAPDVPSPKIDMRKDLGSGVKRKSNMLLPVGIATDVGSERSVKCSVVKSS